MSGDPLFIEAIARGMAVLKAVGEAPEPVTVTEVAKQLGITQSMAWRICYTFQKLGYLTTNKAGAFQPGLPILGLGYATLASNTVPEVVRPFLKEMAERFHGASGLSVRDGLSMLYLARQDSDAMLTINLRVGSIISMMTSAMGWAYIAALPDNTREALLKELIASQPRIWLGMQNAFEREMRRFKDTGFIVNVDSFLKGVGMAAVPLLHAETGIIYTVNCGGLTSTFTSTVLRKEVGPALLDVARRLAPVLHPVRTT